MSLEEKIAQVEIFYARLESDLKEFQQSSGLSCAGGCSACCRKPDIEATILEMLPFAFHLYKENQAEDFYDKLIENKSDVCFLYRPVIAHGQKGGCSSYHYRALLCRLFGYSFIRGKDSKPSMVTCRDIKSGQKDAYEKVLRRAEQGESVIYASHYYLRLTEIDHALTLQYYHINEAMRLALELVLNHFYYRDTFIDEKNVS